MTLSRSLLAAAGLGLALTPILAEAGTRAMSNLKPAPAVTTPSNINVPGRHKAIPPRHGGDGSNGAGGVTSSPTPTPTHTTKPRATPPSSPTPTFSPPV